MNPAGGIEATMAMIGGPQVCADTCADTLELAVHYLVSNM
jgi:hypothetical protein